MNIDDIIEKIYDLEIEYNNEIESYSNQEILNMREGAPYNPLLEDKHEETIDRIKSEVTVLISKLRKLSEDENYYFFDCPFSVYVNHYEKRKDFFIKNNIDANEIDFVKDEIIKRVDKRNERMLGYSVFEIYYHRLIYIKKSLDYSEDKKINFLEKKLADFGFTVDYYFDEDNDKTTCFFNEIEDNNNLDTNTTTVINTEYDTSKSNNPISGNERKIEWIGGPSTLGYIIGYLAEYGYIDAPKKKGGDINYSAFAREVMNTFKIETTANTLQKYLNLDSEKSTEIKRKLENAKFYIPHFNEF
ncbi:hypothetical protein [Mesohalobacter halotolerans]|uniref:Uncharacterized protein n=1 Tax=Mesohalobacter halotolerans TaxID=1883405 RepID=A0A4U5TTK9_9FLAO|nr:hypothetical protein [Mesohalobacter halotolerans]TKS57402.1 hypothetical protein FCN74_02985 [Mesohalobacter halotolerans]